MGHQVGDTRRELSVQIPAVYTAAAFISRSRDEVTSSLLLFPDELGDELWMMRKVCVHQDDVVTGASG